jgi:hypothetical protein
MRDCYEQLLQKIKTKANHASDKATSPKDQCTQPPSWRSCPQEKPDRDQIKQINFTVS